MRTRPSETLPRHQRIARRSDFVRAYEQGAKQFGRYAVVYSSPNDYGHPRVGVTATRKLGKANVRNRLKRWVREVYRRRRSEMGLDSEPIDLVVNVKPAAVETTFEEFARDLERTLRKSLRAAKRRSVE